MELILCVICKLAEEIEKATGKEEQFKVVKGRVIEKDLPSFQPISFHCCRKVKLHSSTQLVPPFIKDINTQGLTVLCDEATEL